MSVRTLSATMVALLLSSVVAFGQVSKQELNDQFFEAARSGDVAKITALLDKGVDVNTKYRYGTTALFKAAERGNVEAVKVLLARGADATVKDTFYGATAMTWALQNDHIAVVRELLAKQPASVDDVLITGVTEGKPELVKLALESKPSKELLTTSLYLAMQDKDATAIAETLKSAGAVPPPVIPEATLQSYVGKYKGAPFEITVSLNGGKLFALATGQRQRQLMPLDNTKFEALFAGVQLQFNVTDGKVTGLTMTEGDKKTEFTRLP